MSASNIFNSNIYNDPSVIFNGVSDNINPTIDDTFDIGTSSSDNFNNLRVNNTYTNTLRVLDSSNITLHNSLVPLDNSIYIGTDSSAYAVVYTENINSNNNSLIINSQDILCYTIGGFTLQNGSDATSFNNLYFYDTGVGSNPGAALSSVVGDRLTMKIHNDGKYGLGTSQYQAWMQASGNANSNIGWWTGSDFSTVTERARINATGQLLIGTSTAATVTTNIRHLLDVNGSIMIGNMASNPATSRVDGTKSACILAPPRTVSQNPVTLIYGDLTSSANTINIGGALSNSQAATAISFYTGSAVNTTTGTLRATINGSGHMIMNNTGSTAQYIQFSNNGAVSTPTATNAAGNGDRVVLLNDASQKCAIGIALDGNAKMWLSCHGQANSHISLYTGATTSAPSERVRITSDGSFLINSVTNPSNYRWLCSGSAYADSVTLSGGASALSHYYYNGSGNGIVINHPFTVSPTISYKCTRIGNLATYTVSSATGTYSTNNTLSFSLASVNDPTPSGFIFAHCPIQNASTWTDGEISMAGTTIIISQTNQIAFSGAGTCGFRSVSFSFVI